MPAAPATSSTGLPRPEGGRVIVEARGLRKLYGEFAAIKGIDFQIRSGEMFGLIGPDGAGKTSIFNIMGGVMDGSGGSMSVFGLPPPQARPSIGYLTQQFSLYLDLSIRENIRYSASLRHVEESSYRSRMEELLKLMDLWRFKDRLAGNLSGGMKQKLALCCALVARPKLLLLDEPTTGVDPISRREFWDILASICAEGVSVAIATPYLDEAERCNRIALLYDGRIQRMGTPDELKSSVGMERLEVRAKKLLELEQLERQLRVSLPGDIQSFGDRLDVLVPTDQVEHGKQNIDEIARSLGLDAGISVQSPTLENVFVLSLLDQTDLVEPPPFEFTRESITARQLGGSAIHASGLSKKFGDFYAARDVDIDVDYGEVFGLLGANGAGKTTTIKMLCGLLSATKGDIALCGERRNLRSSRLRRRLGYMSQKFTLYNDLTVLENMEFYCGVYGIPERLRKKRISWALESCGLSGQQSLITGKLPGGWKQRLAFGACVMHEPEVLFLDEPTSGVDPIARRQLWAMIRDFARQGTAILVTTHFLEEAEHCHRMAFMVAGRVVSQGSPSDIKAQQPGELIELKANPAQKAYEVLKRDFEAWKVSIFADKIHLSVLDAFELDAARARLKANGVEILAARVIPYSLEDSFIGIVERARNQEARL